MTGAMGTAIVTGAGSGIGRATTHRLIEDGYRVHAVDVDVDGVRATADDAGDACSWAELDLADPAQVTEVLEQLIASDGVPDLLVNNAGIGVAATTPETSTFDWERTLAVNLGGVFHTCRVLLPHMIARGGGTIVNVSSVAGVIGVARRAAYCASKAGVIGLTRAIAADHAADGIRVNAICPGTVETEWIGKILAGAPDPEELRASMQARQLDGRMGSAEEVAAGIAFLANPEARFMNGSALVMDGGMSAV